MAVNDCTWSNIVASDRAQIYNGHTYNDVHNIVNNHHYTFVLHQQRTLSIGSNERIGVTACIPGLKTLATVLRSRITASKACLLPISVTILVSLGKSRALLEDFESYFRPGYEIPLERASLVHVDQLVACFSGAVLLFNDLQQELRSIEALHNVPHGYRRHETTLKAISGRLSSQCQIWQTLLHLLQCRTDDEAHGTSFTLEMQTHRMLSEHADLKHRLESMEDQIKELSNKAAVRQYADQGTARLAKQNRSSWNAWQFEEILQKSWVYRRNADREETMSFCTSIAREHAWSEMSKLTLANLSIISVIALPIMLSELEDSSCYKTCDPRLVRSSTVITAKQSFHNGSASMSCDIELIRELRIEEHTETAFRDDEAITANVLRVQVMSKPTLEATPNFFKKARVWASRIPVNDLDAASTDLYEGLEHSQSSAQLPWSLESLDNDDYDSMNMTSRGLYMISYVSLDSKRYKTQILATRTGDIQHLLHGVQDLSRLQSVSLRECGLADFPKVLLDLSSLAVLDISHNSVREVPASLSRVPGLRELLVNSNSLVRVPKQIWEMNSLQRVAVDWDVWRDGCLSHSQEERWKIEQCHEVELFTCGWLELSRAQGSGNGKT